MCLGAEACETRQKRLIYTRKETYTHKKRPIKETSREGRCICLGAEVCERRRICKKRDI